MEASFPHWPGGGGRGAKQGASVVGKLASQQEPGGRGHGGKKTKQKTLSSSFLRFNSVSGSQSGKAGTRGTAVQEVEADVGVAARCLPPAQLPPDSIPSAVACAGRGASCAATLPPSGRGCRGCVTAGGRFPISRADTQTWGYLGMRAKAHCCFLTERPLNKHDDSTSRDSWLASHRKPSADSFREMRVPSSRRPSTAEPWEEVSMQSREGTRVTLPTPMACRPPAILRLSP